MNKNLPILEISGSPAEVVAWLRRQDLPEQFRMVRQRMSKINDEVNFMSVQERMDYADSEEKIALIYDLEDSGVLGPEAQPVHDGHGNTAYWHWPVLKPDQLPDLLKPDYEKFGEIRW